MLSVNNHRWSDDTLEDYEEGEIIETRPILIAPLEENDLFEVKLECALRIREEVLSVVTNIVDSVELFEEGRNLAEFYPVDGTEEEELSQKKIYMKNSF